MVKSLILIIRKKTKVPTKFKILHEWRSDWKQIGRINYEDSIRIFYVLSGGLIKTDAHFAHMLYKNYGVGIYSILAFRKGKRGFISFMKIELTSYGFQLLKKKETPEQIENKKTIIEIKHLEKKCINSNEIEKKDLKNEINDLKDSIDINKEIDMLEKQNKLGSTGYLKLTHPLYQLHSYENYKKIDTNIAEVSELW